MESQQSDPKWQVDAGGQIYEASFNELGLWIGEGSLLPQDKVRKGNLRWIEAQKVPGLIPFFNAKAVGTPMPISVTETLADGEVSANDSDSQQQSTEPLSIATDPSVTGSTAPIDPDRCALHPEVESFYLCETCCNGFCKSCPRSYGGSVKICPVCGAMCKPIVEARAAAQMVAATSGAIAEGFGIRDFVAALSHPFKYKISLFFGALMFAFFSIGQLATGMGGMVFFTAALVCVMLANMLTFGVLANTIDNFVQGNLDANFMPDFEDFSLWDDVIHPFFLSIAAYAISFGPFFLTAAIGIYLVVSSMSSQMHTFQSEIERLPGTQYYAGREPVEQSQQVRRVLGDVSDDREHLIDEHNEAATGNANVAPTAPVDEDLQMWNQLQESRKRELEAAFGKTSETREKEFNSMVSGILSLTAPLVIVGAIALVWGLFFYPAASAVAGYSRSFTATINPLVGWDTIKRLGVSYFKILLMVGALLFISLFAGGVLGLIFSPLDLPGLGNVPAKFFAAFVTFYVYVVFSCIIGYALFKNAHKLDLAR